MEAGDGIPRMIYEHEETQEVRNGHRVRQWIPPLSTAGNPFAVLPLLQQVENRRDLSFRIAAYQDPDTGPRKHRMDLPYLFHRYSNPCLLGGRRSRPQLGIARSTIMHCRMRGEVLLPSLRPRAAGGPVECRVLLDRGEERVDDIDDRRGRTPAVYQVFLADL